VKHGTQCQYVHIFLYFVYLFIISGYLCTSCIWLFVVLDHPYYVGVQFHPEYLTRPLKPSPPYLGLILAACGRLASYVARGCRLSPDSEYRDVSELVSDVAAMAVNDGKLSDDKPANTLNL